MPWSSNYTFLIRVCTPELDLPAIYKPKRGERPLWDFPSGTLCNRERAAYLISDALDWRLVPPTVLRDGPNGFGSVQHFIERHDPERHYFTIEGRAEFRNALQQLVLFDILVNNADRKAGHVLIEEPENKQEPERIWGIDHGICFHSQPKLRTVIWEFAGQTIPQSLLDDLTRLSDDLSVNAQNIRGELAQLLSEEEIVALQKRLRVLLSKGTFKQPGPGRHYPWPPV